MFTVTVNRTCKKGKKSNKNSHAFTVNSSDLVYSSKSLDPRGITSLQASQGTGTPKKRQAQKDAPLKIRTNTKPVH